MSDKPLEWDNHGNLSIALHGDGYIEYLAKSHGAIYNPPASSTVNVPGPYDGTIETAKKRCEEHRIAKANQAISP